MLHPVLEDAIESLLITWRHYDDVSRGTSSYASRTRARRQLDIQRMRVHRLRRSLNPEPRELEEVAFSTHCPTLNAPAFLRHADLLDTDGSFVCVCGAVVTRAEAESE